MKLEPLIIQAKEDTPEIFLSSTEPSRIRGRSLPENAYEFYEPILEWITHFSNSNMKEFTLEIWFDYFNSSTGRYIFEILHRLDKSASKNSYKIIWKYEKDDDLMIERGEALQSLCSISFNFVELSS